MPVRQLALARLKAPQRLHTLQPPPDRDIAIGRQAIQIIVPPLWESEYEERVLTTNPIAFWPLSEASGAVAKDISGNGLHAAYVGVITYGEDGMGDGLTGINPRFPDNDGTVDFFTAGLASLFSFDRGTLMVWYDLINSAQCGTSGADHPIIDFRSGASRLGIRHNSGIGDWQALRPGDTVLAENCAQGGGNNIHHCFMLAWDEASSFEFLYDGLPASVTPEDLTPSDQTLTLDLARLTIPAGSGGNPFSGRYAKVAAWDRKLSDAEMLNIGVL